MCPHCRRDAPILYRGIVPVCTACGALRAPLSEPSVNLAGKPSRLGGTVAGVAGALVLLVGFAVALMVGALVAWLASAAVGLAVGGPIAFVSLVVGLVLILGGRRLHRSGAALEQATVDQALLALVQEREAISATDAAAALGVRLARADALLTALAKREPERIAVEVDDHGVLWYRAAAGFARVATGEGRGAREGQGAGVRVAPSPDERARVEDEARRASQDDPGADEAARRMRR